eukprot:TRINITY_DN5827_c0_g1_i3.p1 TRINITY_DN5827_c0_g1~~TRINITY_DN5827_c0_g1_i3.p1  ORF type:complete len:154 (+),score=10.75 TRINITY_DN5827_c0_g1_i3:139-600(+)
MQALEIEVLKTGDNLTFPRKGSIARVHYIAMFTDGRTFDSSKDRNEPFEFQVGVGEVIKGWDECILKMSVGQKVKLTCPPDYAYGKLGVQDLVPPNATLIFEIELISIKGAFCQFTSSKSTYAEKSHEFRPEQKILYHHREDAKNVDSKNVLH